MYPKLESKFTSKLAFYKPNKSGAGSAIQFDLNKDKQSVFVEISRQVGERVFDWANKITFKLSLMDLGKLLVVLSGKSKQVQLFHDPSKGEYALAKETKNATLSLTKGDYGFFLKVSQQSQEGALNSIQISLADDEAMVLEILLRKAVEEIGGW